MVKKIILISVISVVVIISGGFLYLKYGVLKTNDVKPDISEASSVLDLRPAIIAKLQQLVKDGSDGLYTLSIKKIDPDLLSSKLDVLDGIIAVDTAAMQRLDESKKLPDDIFRINFHSLHIDGIGISDLLKTKNIDIKAAYLDDPVIHIYHKARSYNKEANKKNDSLTLYQRLMGELEKIVIGSTTIKHGTLVIHDGGHDNHPTKFKDIFVKMNDVLIDSSTQYDNKRFLFAKHALIETSNYSFATPDSLYFVKLGKLSLVGEKHEVTVSNAELQPRGSRQEFVKKLTTRDEMYHVVMPKIIFSGLNWWQLINKEKIVTDRADLYGGTVSVYSDISIPKGDAVPLNHFPHQLVMMIPQPVSVTELQFHSLKVVFTQYNPETKSLGTATFNNINGVARHITNIPSEIKRSPSTSLFAKGLLMNKVPLSVSLKFDLSRAKTGQFSGEVEMDTLDKNIVNPIAEPLSRFTLKRGQMQQGIIHVEGDNYNLHGAIKFYYNDLHITPLKSDSSNGQLTRAHMKSLLANSIYIKNENPQGGEFRNPEYMVVRDHHLNFVSYIWATIMTGILKTIGVPVSLALEKK
jgi:hypothetical protein